MESTWVFSGFFRSATLWERDLLCFAVATFRVAGFPRRDAGRESRSLWVAVVLFPPTFDSVQYLQVGWLFKIREWST